MSNPVLTSPKNIISSSNHTIFFEQFLTEHNLSYYIFYNKNEWSSNIHNHSLHIKRPLLLPPRAAPALKHKCPVQLTSFLAHVLSGKGILINKQDKSIIDPKCKFKEPQFKIVDSVHEDFASHLSIYHPQSTPFMVRLPDGKWSAGFRYNSKNHFLCKGEKTPTLACGKSLEKIKNPSHDFSI